MKRQVIGIERGINHKSNNAFTVLHTKGEFNDYEKSNRGAAGEKVETTYIRGRIECQLGDYVEFNYQPGWDNKAEVVGVKIIK
jgi:hypothetical protein